MLAKGSRRYGYYECKCGRTWRSPNTFCYTGTRREKYPQPCQNCDREVFAHRIEYLKKRASDEQRKVRLHLPHIQELCDRCKQYSE